MKHRSFIIFISLLWINSLTAQEKQARFDNLNDESMGKYDSYLASDGAVYKVGDKITLSDPSVNCSQLYSFIRVMDSHITVSALLKGTQVKISKIRVEGGERIGYFTTLYVEGIERFGFYEIELERAIATGEIDCLGMTEKKALDQLKKAKEKLDLQLITQEEYDKVKNKLSEHIK